MMRDMIHNEFDVILAESAHEPTDMLIWEPFLDELVRELDVMTGMGHVNITKFMGLKVHKITTDGTWSMSKPLREILERDGFVLYREETE